MRVCVRATMLGAAIPLFLLWLVYPARSQQSCLEEIYRGRQCCTPSAFTKLSFKLRLKSPAGGCDSPSYLDEGVRLEVRRPGNNWEPIRFYTSTMESRSNSLITLLSSGTDRVTDENGTQFSVFYAESDEPFLVTEYLCGHEYYAPGTAFRWLQRYNDSAIEGQNTWSLGEVAITHIEGGIHCSAKLTRYHFLNGNGSKLDGAVWHPPVCELGSLQPDALYFMNISEVDGYADRKVILTPTWWNGNCSNRTLEGCDLSEGCSASDISDQLCSVGRELTCQCQYPHVAGDGNICYDASVGFELMFYDGSEQDDIEVCVRILNGTVMEDVGLEVNSRGGTAVTGRDFVPVRDFSVTLTSVMPSSCTLIDITDDSAPEDTECFTVSLTMNAQQSGTVQLARDEATVCIIDNDVVSTDMDSNSVTEGQTLRITWSNPGGSKQSIFRKTFPGTANSSDYTGIGNVRSLLSKEEITYTFAAYADDVWEGDENLFLGLTVFGDPRRLYNRTLFIKDLNELQVGFNGTEYTVSERDGSVNLCVTIHQGNIASSAKLIVGVSTHQIEGSAQEVLDYRGISSLLTFNSSFTMKCFTVFIVNDNAVEGSELLMMSLSLLRETPNVHLMPQSVTIEIVDDDVLVIGFVNTVFTVSEGLKSLSVCVEVKDGTLSLPVDISLASQLSSTEVVLDSTNVVSLTMTEQESCGQVDLGDNLKYEETKVLTVTLSLTGQQNSAVQLTPNASTATIFIVNDDVLTVGMRINGSVSETVGSVNVCVAILAGELETDVTFELSTADGTAKAGADYIHLPTTSISLNSTLNESCLLVSIVDDLVYEDIEFFTLTLTNSLQQDAVSLPQNVYTMYITSDDVVVVGIDQPSYVVREDAHSLDVCVTLQDGTTLGTNLEVLLETVPGTAKESMDYEQFSDVLILSSTVSKQCVSLEIINDLSLERNESMAVSLVLVGEQESVQISLQQADVLITDDDEVTVGFKHDSYTVQEGSDVYVCVEVLSGYLETEIALLLNTESGTATDGVDYESLSKEMTFSQNVSEQCISVEVYNDTTLELNESLTLSLSVSGVEDGVSISPQNVDVLVVNDDELTVGFEGNRTILEGTGAVEVCVAVFSGDPGITISLHLNTQNGTATDGTDYDGLQEYVLNLTPTDLKSCVEVFVNDDELYEDQEFFTTSLSVIGQVRHAVHISQRTATVFIDNDDEIYVNFKKSFYATNESSGGIDVCVSVVRGALGTTITLLLSTVRGTAKADVDFDEIKTTVTLSPTKSEACVKVSVVDDEAVEFSETISLALSQIGFSNTLHIAEEPVSVNIMDDDVAVVAVDQTVTVDTTETFRFVNICATTNNTLERAFNLSIFTEITGNNVSHHVLELLPGATRACISFNITTEQELTFAVMSNEDSIKILNPNRTIVAEPSFDEILSLLDGDSVDLKDVVDKLGEVVTTLIQSGQTASHEFSSTFIDVVSKVLDISNNQFEGANSNTEESPGTSLLETLDKFALNAYNVSVGSIESNNTKIDVLNYDEVNDDMRVTSISGPGDERIEILADAIGQFNTTVTIGSFYLRNVTGLLPGSIPYIVDSELVSPVLSSALLCESHMCGGLYNKSQLVRISLHHRRLKDSERQHCVFYHLKKNAWSEDGCVVSNESTSTSTVCSCNHLTHFAVMLSPKNSVDEENAYNLRLIGYVGTSISLVLLLFIIIIFCSFRSLWSMRNYIHINLCISLFISQLLFVAGVDKTQNQAVCQTIAVVLHYAFLVTFMWMLMEGVVLYVALVKVFITKPQRYIFGFTVVSYGAPLVYMAVVVPLGFLLPHAPHYGGTTCWLRYDTHFIWALTVPVILIILANIGFFFMAIQIIWKQQKRKSLSTSQIQKAKHWLKVSVSLLVVMGISWIIGVVTFHKALLFVSYIFTIVVAFQGAIMFIMFIILSKQVRLAMKKCLVRNVIMKSDFLSDHLSEFTRTTHASYAHQHSSTSTSKGTITQGIQLGVFLAATDKPSVVDEVQKEYEATISPSPPPTVLPSPSPSPAPSTPYASSCSSPVPSMRIQDKDSDADVSDIDEGPLNTFTVIFVTSDKDSGRGSPDTDTVCTPPPDILQTTNPLTASNTD